MWQAARRAIAEAESILMIGFSMPASDELLLTMIRASIHANRRIRRVGSVDLSPNGVLERFRPCIPPELGVEFEPFPVLLGETPAGYDPTGRSPGFAGKKRKKKETATKFGEHRRKKRRQPRVTVASLRLFLRSSTGPNRRFQPQSLGRVRDPVRIAEGPTAIDAATQRRHFGFRLRLVDKLQPIGGAWQRPRREDGLPSFHIRVGHLLHERGKIAISLGPNDKMPMVGHQTVAHNRIRRARSVSSKTRSNAKKSSSLVKSSLRPTPRLSTWKTIPPGECRLGRDIHGFLLSVCPTRGGNG